MLTEFMKSLGCTQSSADPCIYMRDSNSPTIVAAYVDDLIIADEEMQEVKQQLQSQFKMKEVNYTTA